MKDFNLNTEDGRVFINNLMFPPKESLARVKQLLSSQRISYDERSYTDATILLLKGKVGIFNLRFSIDFRFDEYGKLVVVSLLLINGSSSNDMSYDYNVTVSDKKMTSRLIAKKFSLENIKRLDVARDVANFQWGNIEIMANELSLMCDVGIFYA